MTNVNFFDVFDKKRNNIRNLLIKSYESGFLSESDFKKSIEKIEQDKLTIGVIGQMKSGKSTFLNAFVFEDDVLPVATTPMTASLTVITYGEKEQIISEFYNANEWQEIKRLANSNNIEMNSEMADKIVAARELIVKAQDNNININEYLGKTKEDNIDSIEEYVGADGKFTPITKNVTIFCNKEYLKGVEVVDTPGFNDPVVSREQKTKNFLKNADMVLLLTYAGRPFDATDKNILFDYVANCGVGSVLVVVNKYDIPLENGESKEKIKSYVIKEIEKVCEENSSGYFADVLRDEEPILISAEMALLSKIPMGKVMKKYEYNWDRYRVNLLRESTQESMYDMSLFSDLNNKVIDKIKMQKADILSAKPVNMVIASAQNKIDALERVILMLENKRNDLGKNDEDLDAKKIKLEKIKRRIERKISRLEEDLDYVLNEIIEEGIEEAKEETFKTCNELDVLIDSVSRFRSMDIITTDYRRIIDEWYGRSIPKTQKRFAKIARSQMICEIESVLTDIMEILEDNFAEEFNTKDFIKEMTTKVKFEIYCDNEECEEKQEEFTWGGFVLDVLKDIFDLYCLPFEKIEGVLTNHYERKEELHNAVRDLRLKMPYDELFEFITVEKTKNIMLCRQRLVDELLNPLLLQVEGIVSNKSNRENEVKKINVLLEESNKKLQALKERKVQIDTMIRELKQY